MCWFALVRKMWGFLATPNDTITANESLKNKSYYCLGLLSNLTDTLGIVDARSIILGIFDPFTPSLYGIPWGELDDC